MSSNNNKNEKIKEAMKLDIGKIEYSLVPEFAQQEVAKVFTYGKGKYERDNWRKGFNWSRLMDAHERHYNLFKQGIDFDGESGLFHIAHSIANLQMLQEMYRSHPNLDDRRKQYLHTPKIVLDVDDVVADFNGAYKKKFGLKKLNYWDSSYALGDNLQKMIDSGEAEEFYINLKVKHIPNFIPHAYVSSRSVPVEWTKQFLEKNGLPCRPVYHVPFNASKVEVLKEIGAEVLIDDKWDNFLDAEKAGITAFLMDAEHNQHYDVGYRRVNDLILNNIYRY